jgi:hypothetical protein
VLNESELPFQDALQNVFELYKVKHPRGAQFWFLHCCLILKDIPTWSDSREESKNTPP